MDRTTSCQVERDRTPFVKDPMTFYRVEMDRMLSVKDQMTFYQVEKDQKTSWRHRMTFCQVELDRMTSGKDRCQPVVAQKPQGRGSTKGAALSKHHPWRGGDGEKCGGMVRELSEWRKRNSSPNSRKMSGEKRNPRIPHPTRPGPGRKTRKNQKVRKRCVRWVTGGWRGVMLLCWWLWWRMGRVMMNMSGMEMGWENVTGRLVVVNLVSWVIGLSSETWAILKGENVERKEMLVEAFRVEKIQSL